MRSIVTSPRTAGNNAANSFTIRAKAQDPAAHLKMAAIFILALITVVIAGMINMHPSSASQAKGLTHLATQGMSVTKTDRAAISGPAAKCENQAWGAWSADCAAKITGANKVRNVSFVTVEQASPSINETILARFPSRN